VKKIWLVMILFVAIILAGCSIVDQLQAWKNGDDTKQEQQDNTVTIEQQAEKANPNTNQDNSSSNTTSNANDNQSGSSPVSQETREVILYFSDADGQYLQAEKREIPKTESIARQTVEELIAGPQDSDLLPTIPSGTILDDINIRDGLCTVDFSSELCDNYSGGLQDEELTVYSIVNTLTQFPTINEVRIWVDGQEIESIAGHVDVSEAMARNDDLITP